MAPAPQVQAARRLGADAGRQRSHRRRWSRADKPDARRSTAPRSATADGSPGTTRSHTAATAGTWMSTTSPSCLVAATVRSSTPTTTSPPAPFSHVAAQLSCVTGWTPSLPLAYAHVPDGRIYAASTRSRLCLQPLMSIFWCPRPRRPASRHLCRIAGCLAQHLRRTP